jgi:uncharacterized protein
MANLSVAIIGASDDRRKYSNKSVRAHLRAGYKVYPVNINGGTVEGLPVYTAIADVPVERLDRVSVYLPPNIGVSVMEEIAAKGCKELWLNPGADGKEVVKKARGLGLNVIQGCSIVDTGSSPYEFPE